MIKKGQMMMIKQFSKLVIAGGLVVVAAASVLLSTALAEEPSLKLLKGDKGFATVELQNDIPIRAVQFALTGAKITEVRSTPRTKGFLAKFNEKNGKVILLSTAGDEIAPGKGAVAEIVCDKPAAANLSEVKIVGKKQ